MWSSWIETLFGSFARANAPGSCFATVPRTSGNGSSAKKAAITTPTTHGAVNRIDDWGWPMDRPHAVTDLLDPHDMTWAAPMTSGQTTSRRPISSINEGREIEAPLGTSH